MLKFKKFDGRVAVEYNKELSLEKGKDLWNTVYSFRYYIGKPEDNTYIVVPAGFTTDGASVPRFLWKYIPPWGIYGNAAIVHDWLCTHKAIIVDNEYVSVNNKRIDSIFYEAMKVSDVPWFLRQIIYLGVRVGDMIGLR